LLSVREGDEAGEPLGTDPRVGLGVPVSGGFVDGEFDGRNEKREERRRRKRFNREKR